MRKLFVITGAGGVLCSGFAKFLALNGATVALLDLNGEAAENVAAEIRKNGGAAHAYQTDCLSREALEATREKVRREMGSCDVLINGAGGNNPKCTTAHETYEKGDEHEKELLTFFNMPTSGFDFVFDLNLNGVLLPTQVFVQDMLGRQGCSVINISSMNAYRPLTQIPAYSAAKAAVSNFTAWLAVHFAGEGIRVNAIAPGFFVTNQNRSLLFDAEGKPTPRTGKILRATPMGRFGEPEELWGTLEWLADEKKSGFVTGITVPVDGGFSSYSGV